MAYATSIEWYIGITNDGIIELRRTKVVLEDGVEVARNHYRETLFPGQIITTYPTKVKNIAAVVWTPAVIAAYQSRITP